MHVLCSLFQTLNVQTWHFTLFKVPGKSSGPKDETSDPWTLQDAKGSVQEPFDKEHLLTEKGPTLQEHWATKQIHLQPSQGAIRS